MNQNPKPIYVYYQMISLNCICKKLNEIKGDGQFEIKVNYRGKKRVFFFFKWPNFSGKKNN